MKRAGYESGTAWLRFLGVQYMLKTPTALPLLAEREGTRVPTYRFHYWRLFIDRIQ